MVKAKEINRRCVILGFGGVAKPVCHIFATRYSMREYFIVDKKRITDDQIKIFGNKPVSRLEFDIKPEELFDTINYILKDDDIVCDFFGCNETIDILRACNLKKGIIYINASIEEDLARPYPSQNALYNTIFEFKKKFKPKFTGCIDAGANPGMITHFAILGLYSMAKEAINNKIADYEKIQLFSDKKDIPSLAQIMQIDTIHISEFENIEPKDESKFKGFTTNTWCLDSFHDEWFLRAEVSIGTHDIKDLSQKNFQKIPMSEPPAVQCLVPFYMKTASPDKIFTGKIVRHPETIEISQIFSNEEHVPTVAFVYHPSRLPRQNLENKNWKELPTIIIDESTGGPLSGRANSNPTTLQVAAGVISHLLLSLEEPDKGLCMPHEFDSEKILKLAKPFLGTIVDKNLPFRLPTKWSELLSSKEEMDTDLIIN